MMRYFGFVAGLVAASLFVACEQPKDDEAKEPTEPPATEVPGEDAAPAEDGASADEEALPEEDTAPAEEPTAVEDEEAPADDAAPAEDATPAEETVPAEEPASADEDQEPTDEPAAAMDQEPAEEPAATEEEAMEETISVSPEVADDAPSAPSRGEPAFENQPQPVYPDGEPGAESEADLPSDAAMETDEQPAAMEEEAVEEIISVSPEVADDAPSGSSKGEPAFENQPQPVYPDGAPGAESEADMSSDATVEADEESAAEEPAGEDVMVDEGAAVVETPEGAAVMEKDTIVVSPKISEDAPSEPHEGEPPFDNQPKPVYPDGEPAP